ncbi:MAG: PilZ domain-containing protein [Crocosphaera sp.]|nr:PilZ domain-containing protein [Crocosphaera sp.]
MILNSDDIETQVTELLPLKSHQRKTKRVEINKGQLVKLVLNQEQIYCPCQATIIDDSFNGCGLLVKSGEKLSKGQKLLILIENLEPIKAQIMWSQPVDNNEFRIGVKYLSSKNLKTKLFFQKTNSHNS